MTTTNKINIDLLNTKKVNIDYSTIIYETLKLLTLTNFKKFHIMGTSAIRNIEFSLDYDCYDIIKDYNIDKIIKKLKQRIRILLNTELTYITDFKCGEIKEYRALKDDFIQKYNYDEIRDKVEELHNIKVINDEDYKEIDKNLVEKPTVDNLNILKQKLKYHIVRWKPDEILRGYKILINGKKLTLKEGMLNDSCLIKLDIVRWINERYINFSCIYENNFTPRDIKIQLEEEMTFLNNSHKYFKLSRRLFSYYRINPKNHLGNIKVLLDLFNSNLGILYQISGDIETLIYIIENEKILSKERILYEIDNFKNRLSNVNIKKYLEESPKISKIINNILNIYKLDKSKIINELNKIKDTIDTILNEDTKKYLSNFYLL
jgi:hypothetical protein